MSEPKNAQLSRKERSRANWERKAARGPGFSSYAKKRLVELQNEDAMQEVSKLIEDKLGREKAVRWLTTPHKDLEDKMPLMVIQTEDGRDSVRDLVIAGKTDLPDPPAPPEPEAEAEEDHVCDDCEHDAEEEEEEEEEEVEEAEEEPVEHDME